MWQAISYIFLWLISMGDPEKIRARRILQIKEQLRKLSNTISDVQEDIRANEEEEIIKNKLERDFSVLIDKYTRLRSELEALA